MASLLGGGREPAELDRRPVHPGDLGYLRMACALRRPPRRPATRGATRAPWSLSAGQPVIFTKTKLVDVVGQVVLAYLASTSSPTTFTVLLLSKGISCTR